MREKILREYEEYKKIGLKIDISRGKPSKEQLSLSNKMLDIEIKDPVIDDIDIRNYGFLTGIPSVKKLFAKVFEVKEEEMIIGGNSSLKLMNDLIVNLMLMPTKDNMKPWKEYGKIKFLCPVPGYDRHFLICQKIGIDMINIEMTESGPDIEAIEKLTSEDETIKGIWCVPQYSNPTGITYTDKIVRRLAKLRPKAKDFKIFWDNSYALHHLYKDKQERVLNILNESKKCSTEDMVYMFSSTSKMTFAGGGISFLMSTKENIDKIKEWMSVETIGYDKINQLRHLLFFKDINTIKEHMRKQAEILRPKFELVNRILEENLGDSELAKWSKPLGGYFISLNTIDGCAKRVLELCDEAGIKFTKAGATYPYGNDPRDRNIRIAPSYASEKELTIGIKVLSQAIRLASMEKNENK